MPPGLVQSATDRIFARLIPTSSGQRFAALDGLRALAVLAVVFSHLEPIQSLTGLTTYGSGGMAVCLFFVLSAFLLYYPWAAGKIVRARTYYARRARRILPAYYLALLFGSGVLLFLGRPYDPRALLTHAGFLQLSLPSVNLVPPAWSLVIEVQFYLLLPLLAFLARRWWVLGPYFAAGCLLLRYVPFGKNVVHMFLPFACGMAAAWLVARRVRLPVELGYLAFAGLCAYQVGWLTVRPLLYSPQPCPFLFARQGFLPSVLGGVVIAVIATHERTALARWLAYRPLRCIGICGYGIFLVHQMVFTLFEPFVHGLWAIAIGLTAAVGLGVLSYIYVEAPAMQAFSKAVCPRSSPDPATAASK